MTGTIMASAYSAPLPLRERFVAGMSQAASSVNVVTTDGPHGRAGTTVSAMVSVSADGETPTLLVCLNHASSAAPAVLANGLLCVNVLSDEQSYISEAFAGRLRGTSSDKFQCARWVSLGNGAPRLADAYVAFGCRILSSERVGTHHVLICAVDEVHVARPGSPLIYANRAYSSSRRFNVSRAAHDASPSGRLKIGCFHSIAPYLMPSLLARLDDLDVDLIESDQRGLTEGLLSGDIERAVLFDLDLDERLEREELARLEPYVLLAGGHPLAGRSQIRAADLASDPMIVFDAQVSADYFTGLLRAQGVEPQRVRRSTSLETVRGMVAHGLGFALLTTKPANDVSYDGLPLVCRPLEGRHDLARLVLARRRGTPPSRAAEGFAIACREKFASA